MAIFTAFEKIQFVLLKISVLLVDFEKTAQFPINYQ